MEAGECILVRPTIDGEGEGAEWASLLESGPVLRLGQAVEGLSLEQVGRLLPIVASWNTNARFSLHAQLVLALLLRRWPMETLVKSVPNMQVQTFADIRGSERGTCA